MEEQDGKKTDRVVETGGRVTYYHPTSQGTGAALRIELKLNQRPGDHYDCVFLEMARQKTGGQGKNGRTQATFDWESKAIVRLDFSDVCRFLTVLEGKSDHVGGKRNGIYHETGVANTLIVFRRDPAHEGCFLGISRQNAAGERVFKEHMVLTDAETIGLRCLFQTGLFFMAFHRNIRPRRSATS